MSFFIKTLTDISYCDTIQVHRSAIYRSEMLVGGVNVDAHIKKVYVPMTETGFYILLCLREERHGYSIVQKVEELTNGEIRLSPGTMYGSLAKMEKDKLIQFVREEEKRKRIPFGGWIQYYFCVGRSERTG